MYGANVNAHSYQTPGYASFPEPVTPVGYPRAQPSFSTSKNNSGYSPGGSYSNPSPGSPSPSLPNAGNCKRCFAPNLIKHVRMDAWNINRGRPYRSCASNTCRSFNGFADNRGLNSRNPVCHCLTPSRIVPKKERNGDGMRELFYTCPNGACNFFSDFTDQNGMSLPFGDDALSEMAQQGRI